MSVNENVPAQVFILENGPLGRHICRFLADEYVKHPNDKVELIDTELLPLLIGLDTFRAADEEIQEAFIESIEDITYGGVVIAAIHVNRAICLDLVDKMISSEVKVVARIPGAYDAKRDIDIEVVKSELDKRKIPHVEYASLGVDGYDNWILKQIKCNVPE